MALAFCQDPQHRVDWHRLARRCAGMSPESGAEKHWTDQLPLLLLGGLVASLFTVAGQLINMNTKVEVLVNNSKTEAMARAKLEVDHNELEKRVNNLDINVRAIRMVVRAPSP